MSLQKVRCEVASRIHHVIAVEQNRLRRARRCSGGMASLRRAAFYGIYRLSLRQQSTASRHTNRSEALSLIRLPTSGDPRQETVFFPNLNAPMLRLGI